MCLLVSCVPVAGPAVYWRPCVPHGAAGAWVTEFSWCCVPHGTAAGLGQHYDCNTLQGCWWAPAGEVARAWVGGVSKGAAVGVWMPGGQLAAVGHPFAWLFVGCCCTPHGVLGGWTRLDCVPHGTAVEWRWWCGGFGLRIWAAGMGWCSKFNGGAVGCAPTWCGIDGAASPWWCGAGGTGVERWRFAVRGRRLRPAGGGVQHLAALLFVMQQGLGAAAEAGLQWSGSWLAACHMALLPAEGR